MLFLSVGEVPPQQDWRWVDPLPDSSPCSPQQCRVMKRTSAHASRQWPARTAVFAREGRGEKLRQIVQPSGHDPPMYSGRLTPA